MPFVTVGTQNSAAIELYYEDHGCGAPVVLVHGYPLDSRSWEQQVFALLSAGHRTIVYDRRGFGRSDQPTIGYDYDTLADDLDALLRHLGLDRDVALVGSCMGTGEVLRYLSRHGPAGIDRVALVGGLAPFLPRAQDNPAGVDETVFAAMQSGILMDRFAFLETFLPNVYNTDELAPTRISSAALEASFHIAATASAHATHACVNSWLTDFHADLAVNTLPTLVVHGTADRIAPFEATAARLPALIDDMRLVAVQGGPHAVGWTFPETVNRALLGFLSAASP